MPTSLDALTLRAEGYLQPIPGPAPAGAPARLDPAYQAVATEVEKLDALAGATVDWRVVASGAGELLRTRTKDLQIASYLARALQATEGLEGLATGAAVLSGLVERYWETMQPDAKRVRGRANAIQWFLEKSVAALHGLDGALLPPAEADVLSSAVMRLAEVTRQRLLDATPAFGPLLEALQRRRAEPEPPPARTPTEAPVNDPAPPPAAAAPTVAAPTPPAAAPRATPAPDLADIPGGGDPADRLYRLADATVETARALRAASTADPEAYRLLRAGLALAIPGPPPASGGKSSVPPPPAAVLRSLATYERDQDWGALLEEGESALERSAYLLDAHRASWLGLRGLGSAHDRARAALVLELRSLLVRVPELPSLTFSDGTPFASPATRGWIEQVVATREAPAAAAPAALAAGADDGALQRVAAARSLLAEGRVPEGLAALQREIASARTGSDRFRLRLALAGACAAAGLTALAKGAYEELERDARHHALEVWEPALAAETLKGLISACRALLKDPRAEGVPLAEHYQRLCSLDPAAAHEVWP